MGGEGKQDLHRHVEGTLVKSVSKSLQSSAELAACSRFVLIATSSRRPELAGSLIEGRQCRAAACTTILCAPAALLQRPG